MNQQRQHDDLRAEFDGAAAAAFGAERAAALAESLDRLGNAVAAVRAYPLAGSVEPAVLPERVEFAPERDLNA